MIPEQEFEINDIEQSAYAEDTALPKDLAEALQLEKQRREETLFLRKKILSFFISWTFHSTGIAIAKWCLVLGGSSALWTAASLCFTISFVPTAFLATGININYTDGQFQVTNMQKLSNLGIGLVSASVTTYLAVKDYQYLQDLSNQTIVQLSESIREVQRQHPETDPWLAIAVAGALFVGSMFAIFGGRGK
ncbi:hypothetical protein F7734_10080 [Scytonema sp. UIC 10036]|uniref:hypothetical protein n=1 Tax=Scytonema sp. UIC 10036 TaxID=2304196 RepID=UPI0012DAF70B|nr:hypothetical protein [Scytonema sp. UIC 10036]MUG92779.1 hypothetical protein [Scytonema sp. UIC 10036]